MTQGEGQLGVQNLGNDPGVVQVEWGVRDALGVLGTGASQGELGRCSAPSKPCRAGGSGTWLQQETVPLCLGTSRVPQVGKNCAGKEGSWEGEVRGVKPGCSPAPELQDCIDSWPVYRTDPRLGWW